jgi:hypothetical protein
MSIQKTRQTGGEEPLPPSILELQQLALGMFLIWDVLGDDYRSHELVEQAALADWARKHKVGRKTAIKALVLVKERYMDESWAHYIHCRDFKKEGWANALIFTPKNDADILEQIRQVIAGRPFKETGQ